MKRFRTALEILAGLLCLLLVNLVWFGSDPGFLRASPHPYLLVVLLIAALHGSSWGLSAALASSATLVLAGGRLHPLQALQDGSAIPAILTFFVAAVIAQKNDSEKIMTFIGGGLLEVWSIGDEGRKDKGRGRKYHRVIYEETQKIPSHILEYHWKTVARPTLTDYKGEAFFIGTASGKDNYWYRLCQNGSRAGGCEINCYGDADLPQSDTGSSNWITFRMETTDNPMIDPLEVEDASRDLDRLTFEQEYKSIFVDYPGEAWVYVLTEKELQQRVFQQSKKINSAPSASRR